MIISNLYDCEGISIKSDAKGKCCVAGRQAHFSKNMIVEEVLKIKMTLLGYDTDRLSCDKKE